MHTTHMHTTHMHTTHMYTHTHCTHTASNLWIMLIMSVEFIIRVYFTIIIVEEMCGITSH